MMLIKAVVVLAVGALAQNSRVTIQSGDACGEDAAIFTWCATIAPVGSQTAFMTMLWGMATDNNESITIGVGTNNSDARWCGWGISDGGATPMLNSSMIILGGGISITDPAEFDRQVGNARAAPAASVEAERQGATIVSEFNTTAPGGGAFSRQRAPEGLPVSRHFVGTKTLIAACGSQEVFGQQHDLAWAAFTANVDTGVLAGGGDGDNAASSLEFMSAVVVAAATTIASSLW